MIALQTADGLMIANILKHFLTAYYDTNSILVTDVRKIYQNYLAGGFIADLPLALPLSLLAINSSLQVKAWLRAPKVPQRRPSPRDARMIACATPTPARPL